MASLAGMQGIASRRPLPIDASARSQAVRQSDKAAAPRKELAEMRPCAAAMMQSCIRRFRHVIEALSVQIQIQILCVTAPLIHSFSWRSVHPSNWPASLPVLKARLLLLPPCLEQSLATASRRRAGQRNGKVTHHTPASPTSLLAHRRLICCQSSNGTC